MHTLERVASYVLENGNIVCNFSLVKYTPICATITYLYSKVISNTVNEQIVLL